MVAFCACIHLYIFLKITWLHWIRIIYLTDKGESCGGFCIHVCTFMFLFVRSMAFWQWTSALSYWNSCSLSSWNAHLEVRDFPFASLYAAIPVYDSAWVVCPLASARAHARTHAPTRSISECRFTDLGFFSLQHSNKDASLSPLSVCVCMCACVCKCYTIKAMKQGDTLRDASGFTGSLHDKGPCYWQMNTYRFMLTSGTSSVMKMSWCVYTPSTCA